MIGPCVMIASFVVLMAGSSLAEPQKPFVVAMTDPAVQRGAAFAKHNCARCHAIGHYGASALRDAPPFRDLHERYPLEELSESFSEGIMTGHPTMPVWKLEPDQIHDLIAYMKTL